MNEDWRGGFLFVGNQLALDLLNTRLEVNGIPMELLPDAAALARWMGHAGLIDESGADRLARRWQRNHAAAQVMKSVKQFRDHLRTAVSCFEQGKAISPVFRRELNALLLEHPAIYGVLADGAKLKLEVRFTPEEAGNIFAPLAASTAQLLTAIDATRVRKCESCIVHFYDTSKKGGRRWCSMNICGNKVKVAAYQHRKNRSGKRTPH